MEQLEGRVAVITGGGSGIGEGLAHACHAAGMRVALGDVEEDQAARVANDVRELGGDAIAVHADVSSPESLDELAARAYEAFDAVHLLCNNAGVLTVSPLVETPETDWEWTLGVNLMGPIHGVRAFVPRMREQPGDEGHIVNTGSVAGTFAIRGMPIGVYTASKYAVVGYSEMLRMELAPEGIGVSVLCPGGVATRIQEAGRNRPDALGGPIEQAPELAERRRERAADRPPPMEPREVGERVLDGVRANRLYIFTHADQRGPVEDRYHDMMAAYDAID
ncbi:MAG: SDR family NAD(P)-dependent oxidoreductase [Chloroflexota bacterium]|nr:SDR family NAD(P)-dependent oxidoreductase [Chloroflexota bacterium]